MEKFSLDKYLENPSRKVVTREGKEVEIIHTNSPVSYHPIVGFIDKSIYTWTIDGKLIYGKKEQDKNDLFFTDEEEELTEFDKEYKKLYMEGYADGQAGSKPLSDKVLKECATDFLNLAKKELRKEQQEKLGTLKMLIDVTEPYYIKGKQDVLKDLPKWKKITEKEQNYLAYGYLSHDGYYLSIQELKDKLPKEE